MKTKIKILFTVLISVLAIVCQEYVRRYFNVNPQIWVFVAYAMLMAGSYLIFCVFCEELEETKLLERLLERMGNNALFAFFYDDYSIKEGRNKLERILKSRVYRKVNFWVSTFVGFATIYSLFLREYFWPSKFIGIMCLFIAKDWFIEVIFSEKKKGRLIIMALLELFIAVSMLF